MTQVWRNTVKLHKKVNLFTLVIRNEEMAKSYKEARQQYFWQSIIVVDFLREVALLLAILQGYFRNRSFVEQYIGRVSYYLMLFILYKISKSRPQIKDFLPIILTVAYNLSFLTLPVLVFSE